MTQLCSKFSNDFPLSELKKSYPNGSTAAEFLMSPLWLLVSASSTVPFLILLQPPCFLAVYGTLQAGSCLQTPALIFPLIKELSLCPNISMTCFLILSGLWKTVIFLLRLSLSNPLKLQTCPPNAHTPH